MPLVSIIVPTYNRAHCVAKAIDSACTQTHRDVEVVVVDDGSTDGTQSLVRGRYASDPRVRYFRQQNAGVSAARNTGFRQIRGDFVALLDSDDAWLPWKLDLQLSCFNAFPRVGMVWSDMSAVAPDGQVASARYLRTMYSCWQYYPDPRQIFAESRPLREIAPALETEVGEATFYAGDVFSHMIRGSLVHTSTVLLRRERFERVKEFNEAFKPSGEDFDFHLRTCHAGPVGFADLPTIEYQMGMPDRLTRREYHLQIAQNFFRAIDPFIRLHRDDIHQPDSVLDGVLAEAHAWIGEEHFWRNQMPQARRHLATSLRRRPGRRRAWTLLAASWLPFNWVAAKRLAAADSRSGRS